MTMQPWDLSPPVDPRCRCPLREQDGLSHLLAAHETMLDLEARAMYRDERSWQKGALWP